MEVVLREMVKKKEKKKEKKEKEEKKEKVDLGVRWSKS